MTLGDRVPSPTGSYGGNRLFEWTMSISMVLIAFSLALPGDSLDRGAIRVLLEYGMTEAAIGSLFGTIGAARCVALFANGNLPFYGPILRYVGSVCGAGFWSYLMTVLVYDGLRTGALSMFTMLLGTLAAGEVVSVKRAVRDGRFRFR